VKLRPNISREVVLAVVKKRTAVFSDVVQCDMYMMFTSALFQGPPDSLKWGCGLAVSTEASLVLVLCGSNMSFN